MVPTAALNANYILGPVSQALPLPSVSSSQNDTNPVGHFIVFFINSAPTSEASALCPPLLAAESHGDVHTPVSVSHSPALGGRVAQDMFLCLFVCF